MHEYRAKKGEGKMIKIVVADDNEILLEQIVKGLKQSEEIEIVGVAKNGQEELEYIKQFCPDIVITDIEMPKMTGVEVIEIAKDFENPPEFIVITGGASSETMKELYSLPVKNIFNKPLEIQRIINEIENTKVIEIPKERLKTPAKEKSLFSKIKQFFNK